VLTAPRARLQLAALSNSAQLRSCSDGVVLSRVPLVRFAPAIAEPGAFVLKGNVVNAKKKRAGSAEAGEEGTAPRKGAGAAAGRSGESCGLVCFAEGCAAKSLPALKSHAVYGS